MRSIESALQALLDKEAARANTHGVLLGVQSGDGQISFEGAAGAATPNQPIFMASITKMFTATVLMQLVDEGRVQLNDTVVSLLPQFDLTGLHVVRGTDHTGHLTLRHLVHQTSGLADWFEGDYLESLQQGQDIGFDLSDVLQRVRGMKPLASPYSGKSHYSDTNFQLLGAVLETVTGQSLAALFAQRIFAPIGMRGAFLFDQAASHAHPAPVPLYYKDLRLDLPRALSSMSPDGGGVWTLADGVKFLRAFFAGELFATSNLAIMQDWNALHFPFQYGYGLMRFKLPRWMNLFRETHEFIGHSGASASWAFYAPKEDLYVVGTLNQLDARRRPFQLLPAVMKCIKDARSKPMIAGFVVLKDDPPENSRSHARTRQVGPK